MNYEIFKRDDISAKAKGIYAFLLTHGMPVNKGELLEFFKEGRDAMNSGIRELTDNGYVYIDIIRDEKGRFINMNLAIDNTVN